MTLRLSEYISGGEIINTRRNSVHGFLSLRGCDRPIVLQLTGNCTGPLGGRYLRFEIRVDPELDDMTDAQERMDETHLAWMQIGVPGAMVADPQTSSVSLEWFGQNGRILVELTDVDIEFVNEEDEELDTSDDFDDDLDTPADEPEGLWQESEESEAEDPFGLFPDGLDDSLQSSSSTWNGEPDEDTLAQWKEWDEVVDGTRDVPLSSLFDPPIQLPPVDTLNDGQVAALLNTILIQLAHHNVAFHMCEHFTPRAAYTLLVDEILRQYGTHPDLPRIGFTMNFDTSEFCDECEAEFDRKYADEFSSSGGDEADPDPTSEDSELPPDDDLPF